MGLRIVGNDTAPAMDTIMRQRFFLALLASSFVLSAPGCYGPDREPGDDPRRSDEGPDGGRPETDPKHTVDESGWGGGRTTDEGDKADDGNTTLDGASD